MAEITNEDSGLRKTFANEDDDNGGRNPSEIYGTYTWKIENFSQIDKLEIRSNVFDVGGNKWYISMYPQGCNNLVKVLEKESSKTENKRTSISAKESLDRIVKVEKDMFRLDYETMSLVEKAVLEPFLEKPSVKDAIFVALNYESEYCMERVLNRLTVFGRRILEVFVLDHIFFNKIEAVYEEAIAAIALRSQEVLIIDEQEEESLIIFLKEKISQLLLFGVLF